MIFSWFRRRPPDEGQLEFDTDPETGSLWSRRERTRQQMRTVRLVVMTSLVVIGVFLLGLYLGVRYLRYYVDGDSIEARASAVQVRNILWELPVPIDPEQLEQRGNEEAILSRDGEVLITARRFSPENHDLFFARRLGDGFSRPAAVPGVNTGSDERDPALGPDGDMLLFASDRPGGQGGYDLWAAIREEDGRWSQPFNLGPAVNTEADERHPALSDDGQTLLFTSNREGTEALGGHDLYRSVAAGDFSPAELGGAVVPAWSPAEPLVALNSPADEGRAVYSPRNDILYFASNREGGFGRMDIYRSFFLDGAFTPPENLGPPVNSAGDEIHPQLRDEGFGLLFSSNRASRNVFDFATYRSLSREVLVRYDLALFRDLLLGLLLIALTLLIAHLLLRVLNSQMTMKLIQRCFLASLLVHLLLAALSGFYFISSRVEEQVARRPMEMTIDLTSLARESIALAVRESVAALPAVQAPQAVQRTVQPVQVAPQTPMAVRTAPISPAQNYEKVAPAADQLVTVRAVSSSLPTVDTLDIVEPTDVGSVDLSMESPAGVTQQGADEQPLVSTVPREVSRPRDERPREITRVSRATPPSPVELPRIQPAEAGGATAPVETEQFSSVVDMLPTAAPAQADGREQVRDIPDVAAFAASAPSSLNIADAMGTIMLPVGMTLETAPVAEIDEGPRDFLAALDAIAFVPLDLPLDRERRRWIARMIAAGRIDPEQLEYASYQWVEFLLESPPPDDVGDDLAGNLPAFDIPVDSELEIPESMLED